ncbi:anthrone oxygenase family protein [Actinomadura sp. KC06]|uniref:anthrone oxygenase family protein n=1 Tax=Actinomadura sp. KC06 TaxID=2530369 RepID=UPI0014042F75|nr:anthrone oxygenase family protein [Actinomadura sp. KC06]
MRTASLVLATITTGLTAGVFTDWSNTIMPGLSDVDDRTFVTAFRALNDAIENPLFIGVEFLGALLFTGLAVVLHLRAEHRRVLIWAGAALAFYLVTHVVTYGVHLPLNEKIMDAAPLDTDADFAAARAQLDEAKWTAWNTVRALTTTIAFACLTWALAIHRRFSHRTER